MGARKPEEAGCEAIDARATRAMHEAARRVREAPYPCPSPEIGSNGSHPQMPFDLGHSFIERPQLCP
jgi:hypothetical protein